MAKFLNLEITREQGATITVAVPDDFDERELMYLSNIAAIKKAIDEQDPYWEDDYQNASLDVKSVDKVKEGDEKLYTVTDLSSILAELAKKRADSLEGYKNRE